MHYNVLILPSHCSWYPCHCAKSWSFSHSKLNCISMHVCRKAWYNATFTWCTSESWARKHVHSVHCVIQYILIEKHTNEPSVEGPTLWGSGPCKGFNFCGYQIHIQINETRGYIMYLMKYDLRKSYITKKNEVKNCRLINLFHVLKPFFKPNVFLGFQ